MDVTELSLEQLDELRWTHYWELVYNGEDEKLGYNNPDDIPDEVIFDYYAGINFVNDDFVCTVGK